MNILKKLTSFALIIAFLFAFSTTAFAESAPSFSEWYEAFEEDVKDPTAISVTPGSDETQMNFAWLSALTDKSPKLKISKSSDLSNATELTVKTSFTTLLYYSNKATASNLESNTTYYYSYTVNGTWSKIYSFKTSSPNSFKVMFVSDVQIGRSSEKNYGKNVVKKDTFGWNNTLETAFSNHSDIAFVLSAGDQVETATSMKHYNAFMIPELMRSLPIATTIGNHDFYWPLYQYRFNNPNTFEKEAIPAIAGAGYYFSYGDALFVVLNSNNIIPYEHDALIREAIQNNPNAKWRVAMLHHSLYDAEQEGNSLSVFCKAIAPVLDKYEVDLALSGHNHLYSRTEPMTDFKPNENGVTYISANSASGSNYSNPKENYSSAIKVAWQQGVPTYTILEFSNTSIAINTYRTDTVEKIDEECVLTKTQNPPALEDTEATILQKIYEAIRDLSVKIRSIFSFF